MCIFKKCVTALASARSKETYVEERELLRWKTQICRRSDKRVSLSSVAAVEVEVARAEAVRDQAAGNKLALITD